MTGARCPGPVFVQIAHEPPKSALSGSGLYVRVWRFWVMVMRVGAEARFITRCVREQETLLPRELEQSAAAVGDWQEVAELAARHGVAAFVREASTRDGIALPPFVAEGLRNASLAQIAHVARLDALLDRVLSAVREAEIPTVVLKGPVLSRLVYPVPGLRPYSDIDLMIRDTDEKRGVAMLLACGLEEVPHGAEVLRQAHAHHVHEGNAFHRVFMDPGRGAMVELHLDALQMGLRPTHEAARWSRVREVPELPGALMLSLEDQIIQLAVHVHKHGFDRLIWLKDLDLLMREYGPELDWAGILTSAQAEGVDGSVWYSLWLTTELFATPLPPGVLATFAPSAIVRLLYRLVWPPERVANVHGHMRRRAVQFLAADSWRGMLPNLILMGRRRTRARAIVSAVFKR